MARSLDEVRIVHREIINRIEQLWDKYIAATNDEHENQLEYAVHMCIASYDALCWVLGVPAKAVDRGPGNAEFADFADWILERGLAKDRAKEPAGERFREALEEDELPPLSVVAAIPISDLSKDEVEDLIRLLKEKGKMPEC